MDFNKMNYYEILELPLEASQEDIKEAYRKQAKKYHPDLNPDLDTTRIMQKINEAYETLSDLTKRKEYDKKITKTSTQKAYKTYTKTREESESDLDEWLKEYLKQRRDLDHLYKSYIEIATNIIAAERAFLKPYPSDILKSKALLEEIKKTLSAFVKYEANTPQRILEFLFSELETPINNANNASINHFKPYPKDIILMNLIGNEIVLFLEQYTDPNNEYYSIVMNFILKKYMQILETNRNYRTAHLKPPRADELIEELLFSIIENNKDYFQNYLFGDGRK